MKGNGMGPGMAWPDSQAVYPQQVNGIREREAVSDNQRLKRRPSPGSIGIDGGMGIPMVNNSSQPMAIAGQKIAGKDALSFAGVLRSRNKFSGVGNLCIEFVVVHQSISNTSMFMCFCGHQS